MPILTDPQGWFTLRGPRRAGAWQTRGLRDHPAQPPRRGHRLPLGGAALPRPAAELRRRRLPGPLPALPRPRGGGDGHRALARDWAAGSTPTRATPTAAHWRFWSVTDDETALLISYPAAAARRAGRGGRGGRDRALGAPLPLGAGPLMADLDPRALRAPCCGACSASTSARARSSTCPRGSSGGRRRTSTSSVRFHGRRAANPLGPAAGPQDQMAQNIVLSWLAGSRILELKTVQINDRLDDPAALHRRHQRRLQRRVEPGAAARGEPARVRGRLDAGGHAPGGGPARPARRPRPRHDTIFDMSVGYDLAGIRSPPVARAGSSP